MRGRRADAEEERGLLLSGWRPPEEVSEVRRRRPEAAGGEPVRRASARPALSGVSAPPAPRVVVARDGSWFELREVGVEPERSHLGMNAQALVARLALGPAEASDLCAACWPGEEVTKLVAARLYTALSCLRRMGLEVARARTRGGLYELPSGYVVEDAED
jgi:hypothetical protein